MPPSDGGAGSCCPWGDRDDKDGNPGQGRQVRNCLDDGPDYRCLNEVIARRSQELKRRPTESPRSWTRDRDVDVRFREDRDRDDRRRR